MKEPGKKTWQCRGLDTFLRDTWVECCGHLSAFSINGIRYIVETDEYFKEDKSMSYLLEKVLIPGQEFSYEYDFGSQTDLDLKVVSEREVEDSGRSIDILARNIFYFANLSDFPVA